MCQASDQSRLADAGTARDDEHLGTESLGQRLALARRIGHANGGFCFCDHLCGIESVPWVQSLRDLLQALRDEELGTVEAFQEDAPLSVELVSNELTCCRLCIKNGLQFGFCYFEQATGLPQQLLRRQPGMTFLHGFRKNMRKAGLQPDRRSGLHIELQRHLIGERELESWNVEDEAVGI